MSDKQGWTEGPWFVTHNNVEGAIASVHAPGDNLLGLDADGYAIFLKPEDAELAAAAPALYAALEAICAERDALLAAQGEDEDITGEEGRHFIKKSWQKWDQARAALLQARPEGGQK